MIIGGPGGYKSTMEFGVHIPQIAFDEPDWSFDWLNEYVMLAEDLNFRYVCANDHLLFSRPWLDGPTALATLLSHTGMTLATTIVNSVVRDPVVLAKTFDTVDLLSDGRLVIGVGPGSSERDYDAVGIDFEERWKRFDESIRALRSLLHRGDAWSGEFYSTEGYELEPTPSQRPGPPIWIGSWGSKAGLRRVARLGDGWLASGYNATPERFANGKEILATALRDAARDPNRFPNAIATMFFHVTEDDNEARELVEDLLAPTLNRPATQLADRLPIGPAEICADKLVAYQDVGVERVYLWPVKDELEQLRVFQEQVAPSINGSHL